MDDDRVFEALRQEVEILLDRFLKVENGLFRLLEPQVGFGAVAVGVGNGGIGSVEGFFRMGFEEKEVSVERGVCSQKVGRSEGAREGSLAALIGEDEVACEEGFKEWLIWVIQN